MAFRRRFDFENEADIQEFFKGPFRQEMLSRYVTGGWSKVPAAQAEAVGDVVRGITEEVADILANSNLHPAGFDKKVEDALAEAIGYARRFVQAGTAAQEKMRPDTERPSETAMRLASEDEGDVIGEDEMAAIADLATEE